MKRFSVCLFLIFSLFAAMWSSPDYTHYREERPEHEKPVPEDETVLTVRCNVAAELYINGNFQGYTDISIKNLRPGVYFLEIRKSGYETEFARIDVRPGVNQEFRFHLVREKGVIHINNLPSDAFVEIDGIPYYSAAVEIVSGFHWVSVKRFGFKTWSDAVTVFSHSYTELNPVFMTAEFELTDASVSRTEINPDYTGAAGSTEIDFTVTADSTARVEIFDSEEKLVFSYDFSCFNTWKQSCTWNGYASDGTELADGDYTVILTSPVSRDSWNVKIDRTLCYPLLSLTPSGSGLGSLPVVLHSSMSYFMPYFSSGMTFSTNEGAYGLGFKGGILFNLGKYAEFGISGGGFPVFNSSKASAWFNGSGRIYTDFYLGDGIYYTIGGLLSYGLWTKEIYGTAGSDFSGSKITSPSASTGSGLSWGAASGFDFGRFYAGVSSEWNAGSRNGNLDEGDFIFRNGVVFDYMPENNLAGGVWFAVNSAVSYNWFLAIDTGFELNFMPGMSGFILSFRNKNLIYMNKRSYFSVEIGLSYLF